MGDTALRAARRRPAPAVVDVGLGVTVAAVVLVAALAGIGPASMANARALDVGAFALAAALAGALGIRRRYPVAALVGLNAIVVLWFVGPYPGRLVALAPLLGCYALAAGRGWRWGLAGAVLTAGVQILAIRVVLGVISAVFWIVALVALAIAALWAISTLKSAKVGVSLPAASRISAVTRCGPSARPVGCPTAPSASLSLA